MLVPGWGLGSGTIQEVEGSRPRHLCGCEMRKRKTPQMKGLHSWSISSVGGVARRLEKQVGTSTEKKNLYYPDKNMY